MSFQDDSRSRLFPFYQIGRHDHFYERVGYYGTGGLLDPKNYTIEPWLLGGGTVGTTRAAWTRPTLAGFGRGFLLSQTIAFLGVGVAGAILDPLDYNEGGFIPSELTVDKFVSKGPDNPVFRLSHWYHSN